MLARQAPEELHGRGTLVFTPGEREIPVFYTLVLSWEAGDDGSERLMISGRVGVADDPWVALLAVRLGRVLILADGRRLRVHVRAARDGAPTLPFTARPLNGAEFPC